MPDPEGFTRCVWFWKVFARMGIRQVALRAKPSVHVLEAVVLCLPCLPIASGQPPAAPCRYEMVPSAMDEHFVPLVGVEDASPRHPFLMRKWQTGQRAAFFCAIEPSI